MENFINIIERINQITNSLAERVIDVRDHLNNGQTQLSEQDWSHTTDRLTEIAKVLERIGNDPNDPALTLTEEAELGPCMICDCKKYTGAPGICSTCGHFSSDHKLI